MPRERDHRDEDTTAPAAGEPAGDARVAEPVASDAPADGVSDGTPAGADEPGSPLDAPTDGVSDGEPGADEPGSPPAGPPAADTGPATKAAMRPAETVPVPSLITAVEIENFKGIGRPVRVELRPITLLFGSNSVGKSTVLHALCYAHEILSHRNVDARTTELGGTQVDLGGFERFVHGHDLKRSVRLRFELNLQHQWLPDLAGWGTHAPVMLPNDDIPLHDDRNPLSDAESGWLELVVEWKGERNGPIVSRYEVGVDGQVVGRITEPTSNGGARLSLDPKHPFLGDGVDGLADAMAFRMDGDVRESEGAREHGQLPSSTRVQSAPFSAVPPLAQVLRFMRDGALGGFDPGWVSARIDDLAKLEAKVREIKAAEASEIHAEVAKLEVKIRELKSAVDVEAAEAAEESEPVARYRLSVLLPGVGSLVRHELAGFRYLGPLRVLHPGVADIERRTPSRGSWADGSAAWDILNSWARVILDQAIGDTKIPGPAQVDQISNWLSREDRLDTGYELRVDRIVHLLADTPLDGVLNKRVEGEKWGVRLFATLAGMSGAESAKDIVKKAPDKVAALLERIAAAPVHSEVQIVATRTGLPVRAADIGVGISQLLPVVVAVLDPDRPEITAIEQPELHLHPRLQVELGDLFAERAARDGILLIETHSEHLLLRIMKRMRQTSDGTLPEGAPEVRPEDVNVLFVEQHKEQTLIREMPLNERGELVDAWPGGFFEEDLREIF